MKKIIVLLVAAVIGHIVSASDVDLYRGLLFWIKDQQNIEGNELRQTSLPLSTVLDGSKAITFSGADLPRRESSAFAFALSFKVGNLNCINRLFQIGSLTRHFYIDAENTLHFDSGIKSDTLNWKAEQADAWYTIVISQESMVNTPSPLKIYIGEKDSELVKVLSRSEEPFFNCMGEPFSACFKLGQTSFPSSGNLTSGQFANVRFWTRTLSDEECAMVDKSQNVLSERKPLGCPVDVKYDFFPLCGNMFGVDEANSLPKCSLYNVFALGLKPSVGRFGKESDAMSSSSDSFIVFQNFHEIFDGEYVLNNGYALMSERYGVSKVGKYKESRSFDSHWMDVYPYDAMASSDSDVDASYCFWLKLDNYPATDRTVLRRTLKAWTNANGTAITEAYQNRELNVAITPSGCLKLSGSGVATTEFSNFFLRTNRWSMVTIVSKRNQWMRIFLNDEEVGLVSSTMTLGYLPPLDKRYVRYDTKYGGSYCNQYGDVVDANYDLCIGGVDGTIDELSFFSKDLNSVEVKTLYEEGAPIDPDMAITPTSRNFGVEGGGNAIITSGSSSTWRARSSVSWITLSSSKGNVGYPVAYTVSATTNAEQRVGYVYVNGHAHEVTQDGLGGTIDSAGATYEKAGGSGSIAVGVQNGVAWKATSNVDWLSVSPESGIGSESVTYQVSTYNDVATRQGTLTIAGNTFTVFQYGRRMKLESASTTQNYETHVIPITVNALAITQWSVTPNNSWISVVDAGNGQGGDLVTIAIAENPSYRARTGTVTIGTETFTVTQQGRPTEALSFAVSPANSTASVEGANAIVTVTATPDLPWTATSGANWLTIYAATANGSGNGNVVYSASPNPTLSQRTGTITVAPEAASGMLPKTHTVTQPAAQAALSMSGYEFEASGESCSVEVSVANIVQWGVEESLDWITVNGSTSRTGPGTVVIQASANDTVYPRSGTVWIAGKSFSVSQKARGVELEYDTKLFGTDGGYESISIHPDGNVAWTAVASDPTWITIFQGDSGTGDGEILYIVAPYVGDGTARVGWITVGDKKVYITQRAYELSIEPNGSYVTGNNGAGEFGVSASIGDVWTAIVTEPWITLVSGYDAGTGSGTVRFLYTENTTGKTRTGKIIVNGEVYTLEQRARQMVTITATAEHGGHVSGGGSYDLGSEVTLTAVPDSGYAFSYWTGATNSMQNPIVVTADVTKSYTAVFEPLPIAFTSVVSDTNGVTLAWNNLAWAGTYRIYRGVTSVPSSATVLAELPNEANCTYLDETGDVDVEYWYWIEAEGPSDEVMSDPMTGRKEKPIVYSPITYENLRGASNPNPSTYREGTLLSFENPGAVAGYTFAGWTPVQIAADMTGAQTVRAAWTANSYSIVYNPNGGSGEMDATAVTYDSEATVATNGFMWAGHVFAGWATNATGEIVYAAGQHVTNLTAQSGGVVTLYAAWEPLVVAKPTVTPGDGAVFTEDSCMVTITCATEGATIYYSAQGKTPKQTEANRYQGPFAISDTATIKAIAVLDGVSSEYVTVTITKRALTLEDVLGVGSGVQVTSKADAAWTPIVDATAASGYSAKSASVVDDGDSWLMLSVSGPGVLSFRYKASCEHDPDGTFTWDRLEIYADGSSRDDLWLDGESGWQTGSVEFTTAGAHSVKWVYQKDESDFDGEDCAWVSGVVWTPAGGSTDVVVDVGGGKTVTVPQSWLSENTERAATAEAANGRKVWECYVVGLDPEDTTNDFRIVSFPMNADGTPDISAITFDPPEATWNVQGATPVLKGMATLDGGEWQTVTDENKAQMRFFKVEVVLP